MLTVKIFIRPIAKSYFAIGLSICKFFVVRSPMNYPDQIKKLLDLFGRLPGVGPKTAERFVFWLLKQSGPYLKEFGEALLRAKEAAEVCAVCFNFSDVSPCQFCKDRGRNHGAICVVEDYSDLYAIEAAGEYKGLYHVLGGTIRPLDEITPDKLTVGQLLSRIKNIEIAEVIIALNPTIEGETTMLYIAKILRAARPNLRITYLGRGLPYGSDIEYADVLTIAQSIKGRLDFSDKN